MFDLMIQRDREDQRERMARFLRAVAVLASTITLFGVLILAMMLGE
ncbi:MAG: hypothetical protein NZR01_14755 [Bryobacteraceae bacterium]|nr:hypothetical protein [Bryobacteraceae bacterium]